MVAHLSEPRLADDLTQEVYLRALRSLPGFAGRSTARTWLLSIARRTVIDHLRARSSRPRVAYAVDYVEAADSVRVRGLGLSRWWRWGSSSRGWPRSGVRRCC
ncbi:sigma factor [Actinokineospora soli]|uniref:RNA polymerase sigma factor n=1 Tax=Actinokineospora soli TaxID=1048753 RepID=A0ABW2TLY5_9PSEU